MIQSLSALVPAVDHDRPREGWIDRLDLFEELEHADGGERNSKVGPAGEVELGDQPGSLGGIAGLLHRRHKPSVNNACAAGLKMQRTRTGPGEIIDNACC